MFSVAEEQKLYKKSKQKAYSGLVNGKFLGVHVAITESTLLLGLAFVQEVLVQLTTTSRDSESSTELSAL